MEKKKKKKKTPNRARIEMTPQTAAFIPELQRHFLNVVQGNVNDKLISFEEKIGLGIMSHFFVFNEMQVSPIMSTRVLPSLFL